MYNSDFQQGVHAQKNEKYSNILACHVTKSYAYFTIFCSTVDFRL